MNKIGGDLYRRLSLSRLQVQKLGSVVGKVHGKINHYWVFDNIGVYYYGIVNKEDKYKYYRYKLGK